MKAYIAGPMAGYPNFNYGAFFEAEDFLRSRGFDVVNPARLDAETEVPLEHSGDQETGEGVTAVGRAQFLKRDIAELAQCDILVLLPGWEDSTGANVEVAVAGAIGLWVALIEDLRLVAPTPDWDKVADHVTLVAAERSW